MPLTRNRVRWALRSKIETVLPRASENDSTVCRRAQLKCIRRNNEKRHAHHRSLLRYYMRKITPTNLGESTEERSRKPLPAPTLPQRILRREDLERRRASKRTPKLRDVHLGTVIQTSVEALEHTLRMQKREKINNTREVILTIEGRGLSSEPYSIMFS